MLAKNAGVQFVGHHMGQQSALFNANPVCALHQYADNVACPGINSSMTRTRTAVVAFMHRLSSIPRVPEAPGHDVYRLGYLPGFLLYCVR